MKGRSAPHVVQLRSLLTGLCARALVLVALLAMGERAQAEPDPESLAGKKFNVDLVTGPIVGPNRVIGLGGAFTALGYGIDNAIITPAAYAVRTLWDTRWFEFDLTVDFSPAFLRSIDFINTGKSTSISSDFLFVTLGASFIVGDVGFGAIFRNQVYGISDQGKLSLVLANYGACYAFMDGQLMVGAGARTALVSLTNMSDGNVLGSFSDTGPELGAILGLADQPFRVGLAARTSLRASNDRALTGGPVIAPTAVVLPAEIQAGIAYQFGKRPLNRRWENPRDLERELRNAILARRLRRQREQAQRERAGAAPDAADGTVPAWLAQPQDPAFWRAENQRIAQEDEEMKHVGEQARARVDAAIRALSRKYLLVSADLLFIGSTSDGIGLDSFLSQRQQSSGRSPSVAFRLGAEGEPIPNQLRLRAGTYLEPSRFEGVEPRLHATFGGDVKLFAFDLFGLVSKFDFRITLALDVATRYRNVGFSVGIWH